RKALRELLHRRENAVRGRERVRARALEQEERHRRALVEIAVRRVVERAELDPRHVLDARDTPVGVALDDDPLELASVDEAPQSLDVELEGALARDRRLVEDARGDLNV